MLMINLLPWRQRLAYRRARFALVVSVGALLLALTLAISACSDRQQQHLRLERHVISAQEQRVRYERLYRQMHNDWLAYEKQQALQLARRQGRLQNQRYQQLLEQLPVRVPDAVWFTEMEGVDKQLHVSGMGHSYDDIMRLVNRLSEWPVVERVRLEHVRLEATSGSLLRFSLRLNWRKFGASQGEE